jgi:hypothetical protein
LDLFYLFQQNKENRHVFRIFDFPMSAHVERLLIVSLALIYFGIRNKATLP